LFSFLKHKAELIGRPSGDLAGLVFGVSLLTSNKTPDNIIGRKEFKQPTRFSEGF
jgi:hypothetical protein